MFRCAVDCQMIFPTGTLKSNCTAMYRILGHSGADNTTSRVEVLRANYYQTGTER